MVSTAGRLAAQVSDQHEDANSSRTDAFFGTPNVYTPAPQANIFATTPGLEQQARRSTIHLQRSGAALLQFQSRGADPRAARPARTRRSSARCSASRGRRRSSTCRSGSRRRSRRARPLHPGAERWTSTRSRLSARLQYVDAEQRPGLLALFRLCAAIGLRPVLSRALRHAPGPELRRQQDLQLRRQLPARRLLGRHASPDGLVVRRDGLRPTTLPGPAALVVGILS